MTVLLSIFKYHLKLIYFLLKIFTKPQKQVFFVSRQSNTPSLNYKLLISYLQSQNPEITIKVSCKKVSPSLNKILHSSNKSLKVIPTILKELKECLKYYFLLYKQMYYLAKSKVVITDGYNILISTLNHKQDTKIIQMWHALAAIKQFGCQTIGKKDGMSPTTAKILAVHNHYDYVLAGSKAMIEPFSAAFNTDSSKILPIGTPYIDYLLTKKVYKKNIYQSYPELKNKPIILYSPTFRRNGHDSIKEVIENINLSQYNLIITLHPLEIEKAKLYQDKVLINPNIEYADLLKLADYVITDYSALMVEAAIVKTKLLLYVYDYEEYKETNGLNIDLFAELPECISKNIQDIVDIIESDKYNTSNLLKFRAKYMPQGSDSCTAQIYQLIEGVLQND